MTGCATLCDKIPTEMFNVCNWPRPVSN